MLIVAKIVVWLIGACLQFYIYSLNEKNMAVLLVSFILSMLPMIIKKEFCGEKGIRIISAIAWGLYLLMAILIPPLRCYLPLIVIDIIVLRLWGLFLLIVLALLLEGLSSISFLLLILGGVSGIVAYAIHRMETLAEELKRTRDNSRERELLIEEKNRRLIEKQDADIYAATLRERNRIAREIHDNVGHMLTRSILQIGAIKTINTNETLIEPLEGLHETLNMAMTNIRNSVHDLHDESVDLHMALREIVEGVEQVKISMDYDMGRFVPRNIKYAFISITKEAVNNTLKHSNATEINIFVQEHPAFYKLLIEDNGTINLSGVSEGIGLSNMRDRVRSINGNIKITSNDGFKIMITVIKNRSIEDEDSNCR